MKFSRDINYDHMKPIIAIPSLLRPLIDTMYRKIWKYNEDRPTYKDY